jgi:hypothetical protein
MFLNLLHGGLMKVEEAGTELVARCPVRLWHHRLQGLTV